MVSTAVLTTVGFAVSVGLIIFLVIQELADASERPSLRPFSRYLRAFSIPLFLVFAVLVIMQLYNIVS